MLKICDFKIVVVNLQTIINATSMNALKNKPMQMKEVSSGGTGNGPDVNCRTIKLRGITDTERQILRIPSYSYLIP